MCIQYSLVPEGWAMGKYAQIITENTVIYYAELN